MCNISKEVFICFNSYRIIFGADPSSIDIEIKICKYDDLDDNFCVLRLWAGMLFWCRGQDKMEPHHWAIDVAAAFNQTL
jgi:hypothetical protein